MEDDHAFDEWQVRYQRDMAKKMASSAGQNKPAKAKTMNKEAFLKQMQERQERIGI